MTCASVSGLVSTTSPLGCLSPVIMAPDSNRSAIRRRRICCSWHQAINASSWETMAIPFGSGLRCDGPVTSESYARLIETKRPAEAIAPNASHPPRAISPTLLMGRLQRLHQSAVKARHVNNLMIGSDIAQDQAVSDLPCFFVGHRGNSLKSFPRNGRAAQNSKRAPAEASAPGKTGRNVECAAGEKSQYRLA